MLNRWLAFCVLILAVTAQASVEIGPSSGGSSTMEIGSDVTSGTAGSILFVGTGPVLSQDNSGLSYNSSTKTVSTNGLSVARAAVSTTTNAITVTQAGTNSNGRGIQVTQSGASGTAVSTSITNASSSSASILATTVGSGQAVYGEIAGSGTGTAVAAVKTSTSGNAFGIASGSTGSAVYQNVRQTPSFTSYGITWPPGQGGSGTTISNDGSGVLSWVSLPSAPSIGGTLTSATAGSVLFAGSGTFAQDNSSLYFDDTNNRLGISTTSPGAKLDIGYTGSGEQEMLRFTFTPDASYKNYLTSRSSGTSGENEINMWVKDGPNNNYINSLKVTDTYVQAGVRLALTQDLGVGVPASLSPLGTVEATDTSSSDYFVMSLSSDRTFSNAVASSFSGADNASNTMAFKLQTTTPSTRVTPLTLRGDETALFSGLIDADHDSMRIRTAKTPATSSEACAQGTIAWDTSYVYVCVATDTWKRTALATW